MTQDLTTSQVERQNILNNRIAIPRIQESIGIQALEFNGKYYLTKQMVADFFDVDVRTIDNYLSNYEEELKHNGYILCKGKMLKEFKLRFAHEIDFASRTTQLGLFDFRSFLNIGMLLVNSDKAKRLRSAILIKNYWDVSFILSLTMKIWTKEPNWMLSMQWRRVLFIRMKTQEILLIDNKYSAERPICNYRPLFVYGRFCLNCDYPVQAGTMIFGKMQKMPDFVMEKCDFSDKIALEKCEKQ